MNRNELYQEALKRWGEGSQSMMAIEEMSELTKELSKTLRFGISKTIENVTEEIADVEIMLAQLKAMYKISEDDIETCKKYKLKRLAGYLEVDFSE